VQYLNCVINVNLCRTAVCWQVRATHKYVGEDLDELTFEPDEIITVVPFDDPEEQVQTAASLMHALHVIISVCLN